jgi:O-antigen/teichoic acid export membrane protein
MLRKLSANSDLVRNVLTLFTGSTIAQAIPVLISPLLTRLYPVGDFATLTVVTTLLSLVGIIVTGRYEIGIGLPAKDSDARQMVYLAMMVSVFVSLVSFVVFVFFRHPIAVLLNNESAADYFLLVPLGALVYGFYQAISFWNIRNRNYKTVAASRVGQSIVNSGVSLGSAFTGIGMNGLVFGNVAGHFAALAVTWFKVKPSDELTFRKKDIHKQEIVRLAKHYGDLPRVNGVHALSDMMQSTLVIFLISGFFGILAIGFYGFTIRTLQAPLNMIGNSFSIVFYKEVSEKINKKERITKLLRSTITTLSLLSFPLFLILMVWGPQLFEFAFGEVWREAGMYARILSPWLFLNFISSPVSHLPVILNKQRQFFLFSLIGNIAVVASLIAGGVLFDEIIPTLTIVAATQVLFQAGMIVYFVYLARSADKSLIPS